LKFTEIYSEIFNRLSKIKEKSILKRYSITLIMIYSFYSQS